MIAEWSRCKAWLEAALHRGGDTLTIDEVERRITNGRYQFWPAGDAAVITQIIPGAEKEFNILLAGGAMPTLEAMMPSLEAFAVANNCVLSTVLGRRGWERTFLCKTHGYTAVATLYGKDLRR